MSKIDQNIKDILSRERNFEPDWQRMKGQLEQNVGPLSTEDAEWDDKVRSHLNSQGYPADWTKMEETLRKTKEYRAQIYRRKALELGIVLIFIFGIISGVNRTDFTINKDTATSAQVEKSSNDQDRSQVQSDKTSSLDLSNDSHSRDVSKKETAVSQSYNSSNSSSLGQPTIEAAIEKESLKSRSNGENHLAEASSIAYTASSTSQTQESSPRQSSSSEEHLAKAYPVEKRPSSVVRNTGKAKDPEHSGLANESGKTAMSSDPHIGQEDAQHKVMASSGTSGDVLSSQAIPMMPTLPTRLLPVKWDKEITPMWLTVMNTTIKPRRSVQARRWLSMYTGAGLNYIITPPSDQYKFRQYDHSNFSAHVGIGYIQEWKKWSLKAGVEYWNPSYESRNISSILLKSDVQANYIALQPRALEFHILQIPVDVRYLVREEFYVSAGASLGLIADSRFDLSAYEVTILSNDLVISQQIDDPEAIPTGFQREGFAENSFVHLRFGMGVQRQFSDRWRYFVEPQIQLFLGDGIGPSLDKIHRISLNLGVEYALQ